MVDEAKTIALEKAIHEFMEYRPYSLITMPDDKVMTAVEIIRSYQLSCWIPESILCDQDYWMSVNPGDSQFLA